MPFGLQLIQIRFAFSITVAMSPKYTSSRDPSTSWTRAGNHQDLGQSYQQIFQINLIPQLIYQVYVSVWSPFCTTVAILPRFGFLD